MTPTPTIWTEDRVADLKELGKLLHDCRSINDGSNVLGKLERIIASATHLTKMDLDGDRDDFLTFLTKAARADRFPAPKL